jgi:hypothetical protein
MHYLSGAISIAPGADLSGLIDAPGLQRPGCFSHLESRPVGDLAGTPGSWTALGPGRFHSPHHDDRDHIPTRLFARPFPVKTRLLLGECEELLPWKNTS